MWIIFWEEVDRCFYDFFNGVGFFGFGKKCLFEVYRLGYLDVWCSDRYFSKGS